MKLGSKSTPPLERRDVIDKIEGTVTRVQVVDGNKTQTLKWDGHEWQVVGEWWTVRTLSYRNVETHGLRGVS